MNCQTIQDRLTDYITHQLEPNEQQAIEAHLDQCADCQASLQEIEATWQALGQVPRKEPSPLLRQRFYTMLQHETEKTSWLKRVQQFFDSAAHGWMPQIATACAVFLIGIFVGYGIHDNRANNSQILQLGQQVQSMKQMMSISMLQKKSSFDRMEGVSLSTQVEQPGDLLIQMLFSKINSDPSLSVRLAAIDAVSLFSNREDVQALLTNSLMNQTSPLVQVALIDQLMYVKEKNALNALKLLIENQDTQSEVKTYASQKLKELS